MLDIGQLAHDLATYLAPLLPLLQQAGHTVSEEVGKKLGEGVWERAKALWGGLRPHVEASEPAREALADLAVRPEDVRAQGAAELQLEKILKAHSSLAEELARLLEAAGPRTSWAQASGGSAIAQGAGAVAAASGGIAAGRDAVVGAPLPKTKRSGADE